MPPTCLIGQIVKGTLLWFLHFSGTEEHGREPTPGAHEDATDFIIRVGSSVGNLAKDWKGQITEAELKSLQYEVSLMESGRRSGTFWTPR